MAHIRAILAGICIMGFIAAYILLWHYVPLIPAILTVLFIAWFLGGGLEI